MTVQDCPEREPASGPGSETFRGGRTERGDVYGSRIVTGLAYVLAALALLFALYGVIFNLVFFAVAAVFGAAAYFVWYHASGRFAQRVYQGVESQAQPTAGAGQAGSAGPREEWVPPRDGQRARDAAGERGRRQGDPRGARGRVGQGGQRRQRAASGRRGSASGRASGPRAGAPPTDRITAREAYDRLGLEQGADAEAVRSAYRERVKEVHPDTEGGDEDEFKRVKTAYERLSDD